MSLRTPEVFAVYAFLACFCCLLLLLAALPVVSMSEGMHVPWVLMPEGLTTPGYGCTGLRADVNASPPPHAAGLRGAARAAAGAADWMEGAGDEEVSLMPSMPTPGASALCLLTL